MKNWIATGLALMMTVTLGASVAQASSFNRGVRVFTSFHFSKTAFGKEVAAVYAHAGILVQEGQAGAGYSGLVEYWKDVKHLALADEGTHFSGREIFNGTEFFTSGPYGKIEGLLVEYWVYFKDGSSLITRPAAARVVADYRVSVSSPEYAAKVRAEVAQFEQAREISETSCLIVSRNYLE